MKTFRFTFSSCFSTSYPSLVNWKWNFNRNANWTNLKCSSRLIRQWTTSTSIDRRLFIFQRKKKDETSPKLLNGRMCKVFLSLSSKITIKVFYAVLSNLSTCMYIFFLQYKSKMEPAVHDERKSTFRMYHPSVMPLKQTDILQP